ncbi:hypothetical protein [Sphingobium sp. WCS2017Hpa-17]|uniref:hypothetical protein n=1 Tax=Sphingobium sp. WCS2017Hpa-17 TaxID=3073638 RepID=UPI00288AB186|nr:hypothetical protein [Sphingobium sp. WCS2017Hpa-17]
MGALSSILRSGAIAFLLLSGCAHNPATCDNARAAAQIATLAMARICPIDKR